MSEPIEIAAHPAVAQQAKVQAKIEELRQLLGAALGDQDFVLCCYIEQQPAVVSKATTEAPTIFGTLLWMAQLLGQNLGMALQWVGTKQKGPEIVIPKGSLRTKPMR